MPNIMNGPMETPDLHHNTAQNTSYESTLKNFNFNTLNAQSTSTGLYINTESKNQGHTQVINFKNYLDQSNGESMMI